MSKKQLVKEFEETKRFGEELGEWMMECEESYPVGFWLVKKSGREIWVEVGVSW